MMMFKHSITRGADATYSTVVEFDPDTLEPRTIKELALEPHAVQSEMADWHFVDVPLPHDDMPRVVACEETLGRIWNTPAEDEAWKDL